MGIRDRPEEVAQRQSIGVGILILFRLFEARTEFLFAGIPVNILIFGEGIFLAEFIQHGIESFGVGHAGEIVEGRTLRFIEIERRVFRAVDLERRLVQIDDRPTRGQIHQGVIIGKEHFICAKIGGELLVCIRRIYEVLTTIHFKEGITVRTDACGCICTRPAAAEQVTAFEVGIAPRIGPIRNGKDHHTRILLTIVIHIVQRTFGFRGKCKGIGKR